MTVQVVTFLKWANQQPNTWFLTYQQLIAYYSAVSLRVTVLGEPTHTQAPDAGRKLHPPNCTCWPCLASLGWPATHAARAFACRWEGTCLCRPQCCCLCCTCCTCCLSCLCLWLKSSASPWPRPAAARHLDLRCDGRVPLRRVVELPVALHMTVAASRQHSALPVGWHRSAVPGRGVPPRQSLAGLSAAGGAGTVACLCCRAVVAWTGLSNHRHPSLAAAARLPISAAVQAYCPLLPAPLSFASIIPCPKISLQAPRSVQILPLARSPFCAAQFYSMAKRPERTVLNYYKAHTSSVSQHKRCHGCTSAQGHHSRC